MTCVHVYSVTAKQYRKESRACNRISHHCSTLTIRVIEARKQGHGSYIISYVTIDLGEIPQNTRYLSEDSGPVIEVLRGGSDGV